MDRETRIEHLKIYIGICEKECKKLSEQLQFAERALEVAKMQRENLEKEQGKNNG